MTLYEALTETGQARSKDYSVVVRRQNWTNQYASGQYYAVYRNGYHAGIFSTLLDVLRAVSDVDTLAWGSAVRG